MSSIRKCTEDDHSNFLKGDKSMEKGIAVGSVLCRVSAVLKGRPML